jgi:hypothetical protein
LLQTLIAARQDSFQKAGSAIGIIIVEVIGFGDGQQNNVPQNDKEKRRRKVRDQQGYNPDSAIQLMGLGNRSR